MITKNQIKYIRGLSLKKNRIKEKCFIVEGEKSLSELLDSSFETVELFALKDWINEHKEFSKKAKAVNSKELERISNLISPNRVLAVVKMKKQEVIRQRLGVILVLDDINDPGNLGAIIRICDWFGVKQIVCSENTVDIYNPKVVQATMGSLFRVNVFYVNLVKYLRKVNTPIYGSYMKGENIKNTNSESNSHLVMGNEANGISPEVSKFITNRVAIKNIGGITESLNVAAATSILLHEFCN